MAATRTEDRPLYNTAQSWAERARDAETDWEAVGWSQEGQARRFDAALRHLDLDSGDTLLDFGCGTALFRTWVPWRVDYYGYDWAEGMRNRARRSLLERHGVFSTGGNSEILNVLDAEMSFDHVVAIGPFNLVDNWWKQRTWDTLEDLWRRTRKGLVVSLYRGDDERCLSYSPMDLAIIAQQFGARHFAIDGCYLDNDLMLVLRR